MSSTKQADLRLAAERGDAPLLPAERMWGFWEFTYANSALAIATCVARYAAPGVLKAATSVGRVSP